MTDEQTGVTEELDQANSTPEFEGAADPQLSSQDSGENSEAAAQETMVPLSALEDERHKRQESDRMIGEMKFRLDSLEQQYRDSVSPKDREPGMDKVDPEDFATYGDMEKFFEKKQQKIEEANRKDKIQTSFAQAKKMYDDFNDVWEFARKNLGHLESVFMAQPDPVLATYEYAKNHPEYSKKDTKQSKQLVDKLNKNANRPQTLTEARGTTNPEDDPNWYEKLPREKREAIWEEYKHGKRSFFN